MAVINQYVNPDLVDATYKTTGAQKAVGSKTVDLVQTFEVAAADDDGSIYRLWKDVPSSWIPVSLRVACDAITGATDWDMGLYKPLRNGLGGDVVDKDILADGMNISAGYSRILALDGLVSVDLADANKMLWELAGYTIRNRPRSFDIALTANTVGSGAGTITVYGRFFNP